MSAAKRRKISNKELAGDGVFGSSSESDVCICSTSTNKSSSNFNEIKSPFLLLNLPDEIILHIYDFLNPVDLLKISELGNARLRNLSYEIKHANFSSCRVDQPYNHISQYFTSKAIKHLKKLNLNYVVFNKPATLTNFICKCKNLTELSIVECGIDYRNLRKILSSCLLLEKLSWNVLKPTGTHMPYIYQAKVKTLNLYIQSILKCYSHLNVVLQSFPYAQDVWLSCSSFMSIDLPLFGPWLCTTMLWNSSLSQRYKMSVDCVDGYNFFARFIRKLDFLKTTTSVEDNHSQILLFSPHLQIESNLQDVSILSSGPSKKFSTLYITLTIDIFSISDLLVESVEHAAGINLRVLTLSNSMPTNYPKVIKTKPVSREEALMTCDLFDRIVETSKFITNLNLIAVHFTSGSPFAAISKLRFLKVLCISSCAFPLGDFVKRYGEEVVQFEELVQKCVLVEKFSLLCCSDYTEKFLENFKESDLIPVKNWKELKCLRLFSLTITTCHFLRGVADTCQKFRSLTINSLAFESKCIYTPDVIYVLKKAPNLTFIQINDRSFYPAFERFWPSIGQASKLEGLCIMTSSSIYIRTKDFLRAIKQLKNLHLVHLEGSFKSNLECEIKKCMDSNHIINQRIVLGNLKFVTTVCLTFFYHDQPYFSCRQLHFRDFE